MEINVNDSRKMDPHFDTDTEDETPAISNTTSEKVCVEEKENQNQQVQQQFEQNERPFSKKMKELRRFKSNQSDGNFRPISMSQSKRRSISSKRLDVGTLSLLESLNISHIPNVTTIEHVVNKDDNCNEMSVNSIRKNPILKDISSAIDDQLHETKENNDITFDNTNQKANEDGSIPSYETIPSPLVALESIYANALQSTDDIDERSLFKLSKQAKLHRFSCGHIILEDDHSEVSSPRSITDDESLKLKGLSIEGGILEFCTINADLSQILDENKHKKESKKASIYDIVDDDNDSRDKLEVSSYISPIKNNCLPSEQPFSIEHIANFCFPSGVPIDFVSKETANYATSNSGMILYTYL
jgi:hypothetical protein